MVLVSDTDLGGNSMDPITRPTLTATEAAQLLGISRAHADDCVRSSQIPSIALGRRVVIPRRVIDDLIRGTATATR